MTPNLISILIFAVLGLVMAIPLNTCIVIVSLESLRKKEKLSPPNVIFMAKGMVNLLLQGLLSLQGMFFVFSHKVLYIREVYVTVNTSVYFLANFSFWMTVCLSAHYCTTITNLSSGFFIWIKRIVSNFLTHILLLTALVMVIVNIAGMIDLHAISALQSSENSTESSIIRIQVSFSTAMFVSFLGFILPFSLSLLCLLLTFSFLIRHVWRVKNNDSGSSRPNLQALIVALRTIFFLIFLFTFLCISQVLMLISQKTQGFCQPISAVSWNLRILFPLCEAAVIFQASNKLKRIILRRFWSRSWRNTET